MPVAQRNDRIDRELAVVDRRKVGGNTLPAVSSQQGTNLDFKRLERETGLEPATACLEGRYSTN